MNVQYLCLHLWLAVVFFVQHFFVCLFFDNFCNIFASADSQLLAARARNHPDCHMQLCAACGMISKICQYSESLYVLDKLAKVNGCS